MFKVYYSHMCQTGKHVYVDHRVKCWGQHELDYKDSHNLVSERIFMRPLD